MYKYLFAASIAITAFAFAFPTESPIAVYSTLAAQGIIIILFVCAFLKFILHYNSSPALLKGWLCMILIVLLLGVIMNNASAAFFSDARELFIPFAITLSSYYLFKVDNKQFNRLFVFLCSFGAICGILGIMNTGGITIQTLYREDVAKNQTAPFFVSLCVIAFAVALDNKKIIQRSYMLFISFVCFVYPVIMRSRTAMACALLIILYLMFIKYKWKALYVVPFFIVIIFLSWGNQIVNIFNTSVIGNYDVTDLNSLTSGRTDRNEAAISFISNHLCFGLLDNEFIDYRYAVSHFSIPHFYILWKLVRYGFVFALPFLIVYLWIIKVGYDFAKCNVKKYQIPIACLIIAYITSLGEYCAPFGPGTSFVITYIVFGRALREFYSPKKIKSSDGKIVHAL